MNLSPTILLIVIVGYFILLMLISYLTGRNSDNKSFFLANKKSPWYLVAIGMIGASLSGATFISIPGAIGAGGTNQAFSYMQMVLGYLVGYFVIAAILMPVYYRMGLTSIYTYLEKRFGFWSHKTGAAFFLFSRIAGASLRIYLVAIVLQQFITGPFGIPFWLTVFLAIALIWVYTFRGGIKTIVWTDTLQTICMLVAVSLTILSIGDAFGDNIGGLVDRIKSSDYSQMFFFDGGWNDPNNFWKQFISGALIAIAMTGLDQDMMQKNLTCKNLKEAQTNVFFFSVILIFANILFLSLGALLYLYAAENGIAIPERTDQLYPTIALNHLSPTIGIVFILGLIAAAYSSADSALTSLTTSFCVDFLDFEKEDERSDSDKKKTRIKVHVMFSLILFVTVIIFNNLNNKAVINKLFEFAGYTYGPLLGLFTFGLLTKIKIRDQYVIPVCLIATTMTVIAFYNSEAWFGGFTFGSTTLALNAILTMLGLYLISYKTKNPT